MEAGRKSGSKALSGANVAVIGLGASGQAAARLALTQGGHVYVSDKRADAPAAAGGTELRALGADVEWGGHDVERVARADLVVVSPGIPPHAPVLQALRERGVPWISEPELAVRFFHGPLIAITGTNGKTTTTILVAHLLEASGLDAAVGGNVGGGFAPAACDLALRSRVPDWYVLEMSSFQLAGIDSFRPDIGVVTNLSPDHLDWYDGVEAYYADKARLFRNADASSRWILRTDDPGVMALPGDAPGTRYGFAPEAGEGTHAFLRDGALVVTLGGEEEVLMDASALPLLGRHNHLNALAAALTARLAGADAKGVRRGLATAEALPHRMEVVARGRGILWVNDSKATNVAATATALDGLDRPAVLLLGGKDKGEDFRPLREKMAHVRTTVVYGAAAGRMLEELDGAGPLTHVAGDFGQVVQAAAAAARDGDMVLLSPACSSFDMFENYEDRGRQFAALAKELA